MGQPAAKQGDRINATDNHTVLLASGLTQTLPHPFNGNLSGNLSNNVWIDGRPAATLGSTAINTPPHIPQAPGVSFVVPPTNQGVIQSGSASVYINGKAAARSGDTTRTCADPAPNLAGQLVVTGSTVFIGD